MAFSMPGAEILSYKCAVTAREVAGVDLLTGICRSQSDLDSLRSLETYGSTDVDKGARLLSNFSRSLDGHRKNSSPSLSCFASSFLVFR